MLVTEDGNQIIAVRNASSCIGAVVLLRIYRGDKPELTTYEVEQWIRYMQYAGVDEVYLYDAYENIEEKLENWCKKLFDPREVFYHDWHNNTPYEMVKTQISAYQHSIVNYQDQCEWHIAMDIDEYPFVISDTKQGFLKRFLRSVISDNPDCVEISFPNYIFSGYPKHHDWLLERYQRRRPDRANKLDKPLYLARNISKAGVHHNNIAGHGKTIDIKGTLARMNHYWGARLQNWKPDTNKSLSETIEDSSIISILKELKRKPLFSNKMAAYVTNRFWKI